MKNFGAILAFAALSANVASARALPAENGLQARAANIAKMFVRAPPKLAAAGKQEWELYLS